MIGLPEAALAPGSALILPVAVAVPLLTGLVLLALASRPNLREGASVLGGVLLAALVIALWPHAQSGLRYELWTWMPGLSLAFEMEPLGLLFATVAGVLWPVTTMYSIGYMRGNGEQNQTRFYFFFALAIAAAIGIALSANALTLFIFYEVLTLSTWPLVAHKGTKEARRGARTYLVILLLTSIGLLLPALVWTYVLAGTTDFRPGGILAGQAGHGTITLLFALYLFGIGKAALMPFHRWLPSAMVAPTPVSALLHAVAVVKAGVFTVLKVSVYLFGLESLRITGAGELMMWVAAFTLLGASLVALRQDNLKARLAYSTVSQLAYIVLGACLATGTAVLGGSLHIVTHAAGKITLFFCAGAIYTATGKTKVSELDGLGRAMPWTFGAFAIAAVSIIGLPPMGGTWSKWLLMTGAADAGQPLIIVVFMVSSLLNIAYLMPVAIRGFLRPARGAGPLARTAEGEVVSRPPPLAEAPWICVAMLWLTALGTVALFAFSDNLMEPVAQMLAEVR